MGFRENIASQMNGVQLKPSQNRVTDNDFYVPDKMREDLENIVATLQHIELFGTQMGNRNYLLKGPPGTGKTLGVQWLAGRLEKATGKPFEVYDGKSLNDPQKISATFSQLRERVKDKSRKAMLVLDEADRFSSRDDLVDPTQTATLNSLLVEMDGTESNDGIYVFAMTNKPDKLDNALRRTGRFSDEIDFLPPDKKGRYEILKIHAHGKGGHRFKVKDEDLESSAAITFGYTGADLVGLLNKAFTHAVRESQGKRLEITKADLEYGFKKTSPSALRDMPFEEPKLKFANFGGYELHKEVLQRIVANTINDGRGTLILAYGPKGTGKTSMAEALAGEYGFNYIKVAGSAPEDKWVGETEKLLQRYLDRAKQLAPCVLNLDEVDALVEKKGTLSHKGGWTGMLQAKLSKPIDGVYVFATVNRPDLLNGTFRDRFVHKLYFGMPTEEEQKAIWELYLPDGLKGRAADLVKVNSNLSCRDIFNTSRHLQDYGVPASFEAYQHLIKGISQERDVNYEEIRKMVGDNTLDYARVRDLVKSGGSKK